MDNLNLSLKEIASAFLILFAVIDILGALPIIISLRAKAGHIQSEKATIVSGILMIVFLFLGESILKLIGIDVESFAIAGAIIIFVIAFEMVLGRDFFRTDPEVNSTSIVPLAFPLIAGAGTLTTLLSIRAAFAVQNIIVAIILNLVVVYLVLKFVPWIQHKIGRNGTDILRRVFGIVLLAIAIKLFTSNLYFLLNDLERLVN